MLKALMGSVEKATKQILGYKCGSNTLKLQLPDHNQEERFSGVSRSYGYHIHPGRDISC